MTPIFARSDEKTNPRILVFYDKPEEFLADFEARFPKIEFAVCKTYDQLAASLERVKPDIVLAYKFEPRSFPRDEILACPSVKWLSVAFAGVDHITPWDEERLVVTNAAGVAATEMAQYALAAIFGLFQGMPGFYRDQSLKRWSYRLVRSARGATVGLVGLGHAGREIARMCRAVGLNVVACRARLEPSDIVSEVYPFDRLKDMLAVCDATVVCAALTSTTRDLFDASHFAAMKTGSYFVNLARGPIVVEESLIAALNSGHLAGAVIDVTRVEPLPEGSPLWTAPNLLITPHTASEYEGWLRDAALMFADNLERWLSSSPLLNQVSSQRGY
ncbi:MAG TPA: D-2-hydroxyacid dehydrogenase [Afipia sp.]